MGRRRTSLPVLLACAGGLVLALALVAGYQHRAAGTDAAATWLGFIGLALCLGSAGLALVQERHPRGLQLPAAPHRHHAHLPDYDWWAPVGLTGLVAVAVGWLASPWLAVIGGLLVLAAFIGMVWMARTKHGVLDRRCVLGARRIVDFGRRHAAGGDTSVQAAVEHISRGRWRVVLVAADGQLGDVVARSRARAEMMIHLASAVPREAKEREFGAAIRTGGYEWRRMAGIQLDESRRG